MWILFIKRCLLPINRNFPLLYLFIFSMKLISPFVPSVQMPKWEETVEGCKERYVKVVKALADKYPTENLLLITHSKQSS